MALRLPMRIYILAIGFLLVGCATTVTDKQKAPIGLSTKTLAAGECGLYVWAADSLKTFTLFAGPTNSVYLNSGTERSLTEINPVTPPETNRKFMDEAGKALNLTLLSPEQIEGGTRYKAGRLTSLSDDGWETVIPVVGLYACQPLI